MIHMDGQLVNNIWTEITGISGVIGLFKIGNEDENDMILSVSPIQPLPDALNYEILLSKRFKMVDNVGGDHIWVRMEKPLVSNTGRLSILKEV